MLSLANDESVGVVINCIAGLWRKQLHDGRPARLRFDFAISCARWRSWLTLLNVPTILYIMEDSHSHAHPPTGTCELTVHCGGTESLILEAVWQGSQRRLSFRP